MTDRPEFFCHLPFVSLLTDGVRAVPCCKFKSQSHISLSGYEQNPEISEIKKLLFNGIAPKQCQNCVNEEKHSGKSFRTLANDFHPHLSAEVRDKDHSYSSLRHVDVVGSNVCNLQCLPCEHGSYKRSKELYELGYNSIAPVLRSIDNIETIADLPITHITLCSGEPFYDKKSWAILERLVERSKSAQIRLDINTNLTSTTSDRLDWLIENFAEVWIKGSIDGIEETNCYLRYPCRWSEVIESVNMILARPKIKFVVTTALSNLSLLTYSKLVDDFLSRGVTDFFISQVTTPSVLQSSNLPALLKKRLRQDLETIKSRPYLTDRTRDALDLCITVCENDSHWSSDELRAFLDAHDRSRQTNWQNTWPELVEFCV